jgi:DNA helicase-2/ATP-dependent DNA helicase PcrA
MPNPKQVRKARVKRASVLHSGAPTKSAKLERSPPDRAVARRYAIGDHVSHAMFGSGAVRDIDGNKLTIEFSERGTKQILVDYVKLRNP